MKHTTGIFVHAYMNILGAETIALFTGALSPSIFLLNDFNTSESNIYSVSHTIILVLLTNLLKRTIEGKKTKLKKVIAAM